MSQSLTPATMTIVILAIVVGLVAAYAIRGALNPATPTFPQAAQTRPTPLASADLPAGDDNLVLRAARALTDHAQGRGVDITLSKHIPMGAGMGGGSSDAAATLSALNRLWQCHLTCEQLDELAIGLGADVPLFLGPPASRMQGRGEQLTDLQLPPFWAVVVAPPARCETAAVYRTLDDLSPGPLELFDPVAPGSLPPTQWPPLLRNDLFAAARRVCPQLGQLVANLAAAAGRPVHLTGSGSALFILADDEDEALDVLNHLDVPTDATARVVTLNPW